MTNRLRKPKKWVRTVGGVTVFCAGKDTIYVIEGNEAVILHRWWRVRGNYSQWYNLRKTLIRRNNDITVGVAINLAHKYGFETQKAERIPEFAGVTRYKERYDTLNHNL